MLPACLHGCSSMRKRKATSRTRLMAYTFVHNLLSTCFLLYYMTLHTSMHTHTGLMPSMSCTATIIAWLQIYQHAAANIADCWCAQITERAAWNMTFDCMHHGSKASPHAAKWNCLAAQRTQQSESGRQSSTLLDDRILSCCMLDLMGVFLTCSYVCSQPVVFRQ